MENENISEDAEKSSTEDETKNNVAKVSNETSRESLVNSAVKFLLNPKVAQSPMNQKRAFLISKGLTNEEIEEACRRAGVLKDEPPLPLVSEQQQPYTSAPYHAPYPMVVRVPSLLQNLKDIFQFVALLSGAAYGCYFFWKRYITQWLFGTREKSTAELNLEVSIAIQKSLMTSVEALQTTLDNHSAALQKLFGANSSSSSDAEWRNQLGQIRDEIKSVKGIMLGTSRFPTNPPIKPISIPNWQLDGDDDKASQDPTENGEKCPKESAVASDEKNPKLTNGERHNSISTNPDVIT